MPCGKCALIINTDSIHENHLCSSCKNNKKCMSDKLPDICLLCVYPNCYYEQK